MTVYRIRLEGLTEKHDLQWVAECPAVQVMSQGRTQRQAMTALNDAVALWFESCIARGTLKDALAECGFSYMGAGRATDTVENAVEAIEVRGGTEARSGVPNLARQPHDHRGNHPRGSLRSAV